MRRAILAAALAAAFCLSQTSHAQASETRAPQAGAEAEATVGPSSEDPQVQLAWLRAEVERLRAECMEGRRAGEGTGTGGSGAQQEPEAQPVASVSFVGRVEDVSPRSIEIIDRETGLPYVLQVTEDTRVQRGGRRISVTRIQEGSQVRASYELISGENHATEIEVLRRGRR